MPCRKRRSNRLSADQLAEKRELRERELDRAVVMIGFGQSHLEWHESLYRTVTLRTAIEMRNNGQAEAFEADSDNGKIVLFRELQSVAGAQYMLPTLPNAASADALSQYTDGSRMAGHLMRRVENAIMFPFVQDTKAPLARPRVSERDCVRARGLMRRMPDPRAVTRVLRNLPLAA